MYAESVFVCLLELFCQLHSTTVCVTQIAVSVTVWKRNKSQLERKAGTHTVGIIKRGVLQAYARARESSAMLCSVHVFRVFLCIFYLKKSGRAKGAAKGSCRATVVQKGVFGESVSSLPP